MATNVGEQVWLLSTTSLLDLVGMFILMLCACKLVCHVPKRCFFLLHCLI